MELYGHSQAVFGYAESADGGKWFAHYDGTSTVSLHYNEEEHIVWTRFDENANIFRQINFFPDDALL
jgi:hypothetical protein